ncbi:hypothetical protein GCM10022415_31600 [Knoellia locipacati]|uniref:Uncharacterized protein n=1 Tax=Knoellia locipacati TaxID=882824 RepID=A0A512T3P2_9MICO|nr:hypothetical protein [Knoellia locipacati]GEQ14836.1 hypothetical protein KLO01_28830 [Knoellia locipacati]
MKKALATLVAFVGLVLAGVGVAGIVLVGSDDVVDSPTTTLRLGGAKAVVSTPGLLAFRDTTMRVSARRDGGRVFLGRAHPIDVGSYLKDVPTYAVTRVGPSGLSGEVVEGRATVVPADPTVQTFWTDRTTGTGTRSLSLDLDGSPTAWVIVPLGQGGDLEVTSGIVVPHGFALSVTALVGGVLVAAGGLLLRRRQRRRHHSSVSRDVGDPAPPARAGRRPAPLLALAVIPTMAGCGLAPTQVQAWQPDTLTKPALTRPEAVAAMKAYDARNTAATRTASTTFDARAWQQVDTGIVFASDQYAAAHNRLVRPAATGQGTTTVDRVFAPSFGAYPMYALVAGTETWKVVPAPKAPATPTPPAEVLVAMKRESVTTPWRKMASSPAPRKALPQPLDTAAVGARPTDTTQVLAAVARVTTKLNTGRGAVALPENVADFLAGWRTPKSYLASSRAMATLWAPDEKDQTSPVGSVQVARTASGHVALVSYLVRVDYVAKPGQSVFFENTEFAAVIGQSGSRDALRFRAALTLAVTIDDKGVPTVVGGDVDSLI